MGVRGQGIRGVRGAGGPGGGHLIPGGPHVERARGRGRASIGPVLKGEGRTKN